MREQKRARAWLTFMLAAFFALNLPSLTRFPLVHSDEAWLAGLTRHMMAKGSFGVTEPFFDLKPRYPHAIKLLFHLMQMPFLSAFGHGAWSVRLLSLLGGVLALVVFFRCCLRMAPFPLALGSTVLCALSGQFLFAARTARQEILLLCALLTLTLVLLEGKGAVGARRAAVLGALTGLAAGLHPNSLLLALGVGLTFIGLMLAGRRGLLKPLMIYITVTGAIALCFVALSFAFDRQFPAHYRMYGEAEFGLSAPFWEKAREFPLYLKKLWHGVSGTYLLPSLKAQLILIPPLLIWAAVRAIRTRAAELIILLGMIGGVVSGTIIIGRYNQLSASLWMLPCLLLIPWLMKDLPRRRWALILLAGAFALSSACSIAPMLTWQYEDYLRQAAAFVQPGEKALANLSLGFHFDDGALLDLRNLSFLKEHDLSFADYVRTRGVRVILWPEEMDFIYSRRPAWNMIYGNPRYTPEAEAFFAEHCTLLGTFENGGYAVRIAQEVGKPYRVRVYRVKD
ncbi:MAG: hypothetical protein VB115_16295 [Christensenellaceae bacterium]|nr:hypothetical protein [Christensenellaceae bacterium]